MERFSGQPNEPLEHDLVFEVTKEKALEALQSGNMELVRSWYDQEAATADLDPTGRGRTLLAIELAKIQHAAGYNDEAVSSLDDAAFDAVGQGGEDLLVQIFRLKAEFQKH